MYGMSAKDRLALFEKKSTSDNKKGASGPKKIGKLNVGGKDKDAEKPAGGVKAKKGAKSNEEPKAENSAAANGVAVPVGGDERKSFAPSAPTVNQDHTAAKTVDQTPPVDQPKVEEGKKENTSAKKDSREKIETKKGKKINSKSEDIDTKDTSGKSIDDSKDRAKETSESTSKKRKPWEKKEKVTETKQEDIDTKETSGKNIENKPVEPKAKSKESNDKPKETSELTTTKRKPWEKKEKITEAKQQDIDTKDTSKKTIEESKDKPKETSESTGTKRKPWEKKEKTTEAKQQDIDTKDVSGKNIEEKPVEAKGTSESTSTKRKPWEKKEKITEAKQDSDTKDTSRKTIEESKDKPKETSESTSTKRKPWEKKEKTTEAKQQDIDTKDVSGKNIEEKPVEAKGTPESTSNKRKPWEKKEKVTEAKQDSDTKDKSGKTINDNPVEAKESRDKPKETSESTISIRKPWEKKEKATDINTSGKNIEDKPVEAKPKESKDKQKETPELTSNKRKPWEKKEKATEAKQDSDTKEKKGKNIDEKPAQPTEEIKDKPIQSKEETKDKPIQPKQETKDKPIQPKEEIKDKPVEPKEEDKHNKAKPVESKQEGKDKPVQPKEESKEKLVQPKEELKDIKEKTVKSREETNDKPVEPKEELKDIKDKPADSTQEPKDKQVQLEEEPKDTRDKPTEPQVTPKDIKDTPEAPQEESKDVSVNLTELTKDQRVEVIYDTKDHDQTVDLDELTAEAKTKDTEDKPAVDRVQDQEVLVSPAETTIKEVKKELLNTVKDTKDQPSEEDTTETQDSAVVEPKGVTDKTSKTDGKGIEASTNEPAALDNITDTTTEDQIQPVAASVEETDVIVDAQVKVDSLTGEKSADEIDIGSEEKKPLEVVVALDTTSDVHLNETSTVVEKSDTITKEPTTSLPLVDKEICGTKDISETTKSKVEDTMSGLEERGKDNNIELQALSVEHISPESIAFGAEPIEMAATEVAANGTVDDDIQPEPMEVKPEREDSVELVLVEEVEITEKKIIVSTEESSPPVLLDGDATLPGETQTEQTEPEAISLAEEKIISMEESTEPPATGDAPSVAETDVVTGTVSDIAESSEGYPKVMKEELDLDLSAELEANIKIEKDTSIRPEQVEKVNAAEDQPQQKVDASETNVKNEEENLPVEKDEAKEDIVETVNASEKVEEIILSVAEEVEKDNGKEDIIETDDAKKEEEKIIISVAEEELKKELPALDDNVKPGVSVFKSVPEEFYDTLFYFSGMGTVVGSALSKGVYVPQRVTKTALDVECIESYESVKDDEILKETKTIRTARHQANDLSEELKKLQSLLGGLPTFADTAATTAAIVQRGMMGHGKAAMVDSAIHAKYHSFQPIGKPRRVADVPPPLKLELGASYGSAFRARPGSGPPQSVTSSTSAPTKKPDTTSKVQIKTTVVPEEPKLQTTTTPAPPPPPAITKPMTSSAPVVQQPPKPQQLVTSSVPVVQQPPKLQQTMPPAPPPPPPPPPPAQAPAKPMTSSVPVLPSTAPRVPVTSSISVQQPPPTILPSTEFKPISSTTTRINRPLFLNKENVPLTTTFQTNGPSGGEAHYKPKPLAPLENQPKQGGARPFGEYTADPKMTTVDSTKPWQERYGVQQAVEDSSPPKPYEPAGQIPSGLKPWELSRMRGLEARGFQFSHEMPKSGADYSDSFYHGNSSIESGLEKDQQRQSGGGREGVGGGYVPFLVSGRSKSTDREKKTVLAQQEARDTPPHMYSGQGESLPYSDC